MTSIFLAERWSRIGDTVSALNCQLASLTAQNRQKKICCVVLKATEEEKKDAADCGVELILPSLSDDITDACENDEPCYKWLLSPDQYFSTLTNLQSVEYIVEHVKSLTSFLCASVLRNRCFKDADIVLINHETPSADLRDRHLKFAEAAGTVFSVKATVFEEYTRLYQMTKIQIKHELYLPRPEKAFFDLNVDQMCKISDFKQILTVITDKKVESKRFKVLSAGVGKTADGFKFMHAKIPKWFVRSASAADLSDTANFLNNNLNSTYIEPNTYPPYGSQDEIYRDIQQSNVLVIPPDEPFRMEALWAIAAGLPVLVPRRTPMAEFLKKYFGERAEYFLYEPSIDDLSAEISKMLNRTETVSVTRKLKDAFQSHPEINGSHGNFTACFNKPAQPYGQPAPVAAASSPSHRHSTDDGIGSIGDTSSQQSLSPQPASPESPVFLQEPSTSQAQSAPAIARKRPLMPTLLCEANLEFEEKKMKMETTHLMERERQQFELQKERDQHQFKIQKREALLAEIKELYELEKQKIMARNSPDLVKELYEAFYNFKARLDEITDGSLQFMLSFLSEEDIDHFWLKYTAVDVEEVMNGILITPKMRLLAEEAGCTARIRLKIDRREYETVKEILHDMSTEYTVPEKTWVRSVAWDKWERYVVDHVHENQAKYLIEQSRVHPVVNELRKDDFFFPSLASYWHDNFYTLPRTLTEATEYAINKDVVRYCEEHGIKIGNVYDVVQEGLHEVGKQAFHNFTSEVRSNASFYAKTGKKQIFCRKLSVSCNKRYLLCLLRKKHDNSFVFLNDHLYFYAVAVYLSTNLHKISEEGVLEALVFSKPIALYFVAGILSDKLESFIEPVANYAQTVTPITFESLSLLGSCLLESKCPEKFGEILQRSFKSLVLDLSSVTFASISDYCKEALAFILTKTSIIPEIIITNKEEVSGLSKTFLECLKHYVIQPPCSVDIEVENVHELTVFSRFVVFHKLFIAQKHSLVKQHGHLSLESISINAVNTFYDADYETALALVNGFASLPLLHTLRFTGFNEKFIIDFLQFLTESNARLTVKCMELPHNGLGDDFVSVMMKSIKWLPFLKQIDIRDNNLSGNGCVALLPLADEIDVLVEGNGVQENFEKLLECIPVSDQTRDTVPSLSKLQTIDDIRKLQVKVRDVTKIKVSILPFDAIHMCSNISLFSNLENLSLSHCGITKSSTLMLADSFKCLRALKYVDLSLNNIGDDGIKYIGGELHILEFLMYADLSATDITCSGMIELLKTVEVGQQKIINVSKNLTQLVYIIPYIKYQLLDYPHDINRDEDTVTLDRLVFLYEIETQCIKMSVNNKKWDEREFGNFCKGLSILTVLNYLDLSHSNIGHIGVEHLSQAMVKMTQLRGIDLSHNDIGEPGAQILGKGFENMTMLEYLKLDHNNIGNVGAHMLSTGIANMKQLWSLSLSHNNIGNFGAECLGHGLKTATRVEHIDISHNSIGNIGVECIMEGAENMKWLSHLDLCHNKIKDVDSHNLKTVMEKMTTLRVLDLSHNEIGDLYAECLSSGFHLMTQYYDDLGHNIIEDIGGERISKGVETLALLGNLNLSFNRIGHVGAERLIKALKKMTWLRHMDLSHNNIGDMKAESLLQGVEELTWLQYLNLSHNKIGDEGICFLCHGIQKLTLLRHFDLSNNKIGDVGAESLSKKMENLYELRHLDLSHNMIYKIGLTSETKGVVSLRKLRHLDLSYNEISDSGVETLSAWIEKLVHLRHINIGHNKIGDFGSRIVGGVIQNLTRLRHLDLSYNNISDVGVDSISKGMELLSQLKYVDLSYNRIGDNGAETLSKLIENAHQIRVRELTSREDTFDISPVVKAKVMQLEYLDLSYNCITDHGVVSLSRIVGTLKLSLFVDLNHNNVYNMPDYIGARQERDMAGAAAHPTYVEFWQHSMSKHIGDVKADQSSVPSYESDFSTGSESSDAIDSDQSSGESSGYDSSGSFVCSAEW